MPTQSEQSQTAQLRITFSRFVDSVTKVVSHSCTTAAFRNAISGQCSETEHLFSVFAQQATQIISSKQHFRRGRLPTDRQKNAAPASAVSFLKCWTNFAKLCTDVRFTGPDAIKQTINTNFEIIATSFDFIWHAVGGINTSLNASSSSLQTMILQKNSLQKEALELIETPQDSERLKNLSAKVKTFSRMLNDCFGREFAQCGIPQNDLVKIRQKTYTACCDIVSALRCINNFDNDLNECYKTLDDFQESLLKVCELLDLPMAVPEKRKMRISRSADRELFEIQREVEAEEEEDKEDDLTLFNNCKNTKELAERGKENLELLHKKKNNEKYIDLLIELAANDENQINELTSKLDELENEISESQKRIHELEERNQNLVNTNKELQSTLGNMDTFELKECLAGVACSLSTKLNKPPFSFEDNKQMINSVNELVKEEINLECSICKKNEETFKKIKDLLCSFVYREENNTIFDLINKAKTETQTLRDKVNELELKNKTNSEKCEEFVALQKKLLEFYQLNTEIDLNDSKKTHETILEGAKEAINKKEREFIALFAEKQREIENSVESIINKLSKIVEPCKEGDAFQRLNNSVDRVIEQSNNGSNQQEKLKSAIKEASMKLAHFLSLPVSEQINGEYLLDLVKKLEESSKDDIIKKLESTNQYLVDAFDNVSVKLRGGKEVDKLNRQQMSPQVHVSLTMKALEHYIQSKNSLAKEYEALKSTINSVNETCLKELGAKGKDESSEKQVLNNVNEIIKRKKAAEQKPPKKETDFSSLAKIFDLVEVSSRTDPNIFVPEICASYTSMSMTITALKPFASILNDIFASFDCKFNSFIPGSAQCKTLKQHVMKLHSSLSSIVPSKINSLVFLILSRFIALLSSFLSALTALSFSPNDMDQKNYLFSIQQENERLNDLIESKKNI